MMVLDPVRLKLDRRIHNQRRALRDNWMIVDQRQSGHRHFTLGCIRKLGKLCDLLDIPKQSETGGYYTLLHRADRAIETLTTKDDLTEQGEK